MYLKLAFILHVQVAYLYIVYVSLEHPEKKKHGSFGKIASWKVTDVIFYATAVVVVMMPENFINICV